MDQSEKNFYSKYEFIKTNTKKGCLGVGSFATVKLALEKQTQRQVAIKVIDKNTKYSSTDRKNLKKEVYYHRKLDYPNVIKFIDFYETPSHAFIVLEYAENGSLFSYLSKKKKFNENEARLYFLGAAKAIGYIHSRKVIHRDFKPENILLDKHYTVKLCDFGWCTELTKEKKRTFCGTYEYMAPEMINKQQYDYTIDIWGLGILLYELLHGYSPFRGPKPEDISKNISKNQIIFSGGVSQEAKDLILRILKKNPGDRLEIERILQHPWCQKGNGITTPKLNKELKTNNNIINQTENQHQEIQHQHQQQQQEQQEQMQGKRSQTAENRQQRIMNYQTEVEVQQNFEKIVNKIQNRNQILDQNKENVVLGLVSHSETKPPASKNKVMLSNRMQVQQQQQKSNEFRKQLSFQFNSVSNQTYYSSDNNNNRFSNYKEDKQSPIINNNNNKFKHEFIVDSSPQQQQQQQRDFNNKNNYNVSPGLFIHQNSSSQNEQQNSATHIYLQQQQQSSTKHSTPGTTQNKHRPYSIHRMIISSSKNCTPNITKKYLFNEEIDKQQQQQQLQQYPSVQLNFSGIKSNNNTETDVNNQQIFYSKYQKQFSNQFENDVLQEQNHKNITHIHTHTTIGEFDSCNHNTKPPLYEIQNNLSQNRNHNHNAQRSYAMKYNKENINISTK